jgi:hypothetical protein
MKTTERNIFHSSNLIQFLLWLTSLAHLSVQHSSLLLLQQKLETPLETRAQTAASRHSGVMEESMNKELCTPAQKQANEPVHTRNLLILKTIRAAATITMI